MMKNRIDEHMIRATVTSIRWERIYLHLDVKIETAQDYRIQEPLCFYAMNGEFRVRAKFAYTRQADNLYHLKANITNTGACVAFPKGTYRILVCQGEEILALCMFDEGIVGELAEHSRNFLYGGRQKVYTVTFYVGESDTELPFIMYVLPAASTGIGFPKNKTLRAALNPVSGLKGWLFGSRAFLRRAYQFYSNRYRKNRKHTILFMSEQNPTIASNLKAVSDRMIARGMGEQYEIFYSARSAAAEQQSGKSWLELIKKMAKSGYIFLDDHAPVLDWLTLEKDTTVVQLWHAGAGFKSSGYSRWGQLGAPGPASAHRQYTYGIAGSREIACFFSEVWGINDIQVLPTGMPRMDEYLDETHKQEKIRELYETFPYCKDKKVLLFAPTYRGRNKKTAYYPYDLIDFERLYQICLKKNYVVLFKMHPWVNEDITIPQQYADRFYSVLTFPNINDLFYITDLLITDYSSSIFEYSLMKRPMLFYAYDKIQYSFSRGFHRAYEESAPGKVCYTFDELMDAFEQEDFELEKVQRYIDYHFDYIDSNASDRVIDWILCDQMPQDIREGLEQMKQENAYIESMEIAPFEL